MHLSWEMSTQCTRSNCVHRRQLLAARALNERSKDSPSRAQRPWRRIFDDLVILSVLQFSNVHLVSPPIEVQRADALFDFLQMPANAGKSGSTLLGEFWGGRLNGVSGTLGFPLERQVSLVLVTMLIFEVGANRTVLQRLLGGRALALTFRREVFGSLDVSCTAATSLRPSRRCRLNRALLDELLLITGLAPFFFLESKLASGTLRNTLRYKRISEWRWRLLRVHHTGGLARVVRFGRRGRGACSP